ncbi:hypothetical protein Droror1_Dr00027387 [Drosera rotundifolia]
MDHENIAAPSLCSSNRSAHSKNKNTNHAFKATSGKSVECTSHHCKACTAVLIADSVAVCCCPLAVVSFLALAFVKVPYMMGKRCLGLHHRRKKPKKICQRNNAALALAARRNNSNLLVRKSGCGGNDSARGDDNDIVLEFEEGKEAVEDRKSFCVDVDQAESFFLEMYQLGQLGFGRVSFTGMQSGGKNN